MFREYRSSQNKKAVVGRLFGRPKAAQQAQAQQAQAQAQHATGPGKRGSTTLAATVTGVLVAQGDPHQREVCALEGAASRCGRIDAAKSKAKTRGQDQAKLGTAAAAIDAAAPDSAAVADEEMTTCRQIRALGQTVDVTRQRSSNKDQHGSDRRRWQQRYGLFLIYLLISALALALAREGANATRETKATGCATDTRSKATTSGYNVLRTRRGDERATCGRVESRPKASGRGARRDMDLAEAVEAQREQRLKCREEVRVITGALAESGRARPWRRREGGGGGGGSGGGGVAASGWWRWRWRRRRRGMRAKHWGRLVLETSRRSQSSRQ
ncbi:hypothetical protein E4U26_007992 [Claviceps purpurea]|nr:hypothetical protein E4U26_007992 [Claviceps purpurea]